ncbi:MAG: efflux RND transporter periplasmic adaptor subunit [Marinobacterium sp.]|nr:efflux RND transporter periplasmic adaptor subunit [Marinobacterium sp.]
MNRSVLSAVVIVAGLGAWMFSGLARTDNSPLPVEKEPQAKPLMKVQVFDSRATLVSRTISVQGQVEALRRVQIKAEVDGRVEMVPVPEGARVDKNAVLIRLAEDYRPAQLQEAKARLKQRQSDLLASQKLRKRGLQAENQIVADMAEVEAARAQLAQIRYQLQHTRIRAPFSGVLNHRNVEVGDFVERGMQVVELVDDEQLVVTGQVPQTYATVLIPGQPVEVQLVTGERLEGSLKFVSATADDETRSYRAEVRLDNPEHRRLIGLSASLILPVAQLQGHRVPGSVLGLSTEGELQVKIVDKNSQVQIETVELIRTDKDGFWVSGLPANVTLISTGQHFVGAGERVEAVRPAQQQEGAVANASID